MRAILEDEENRKMPQVYVGDSHQDVYNFRPRCAKNIFAEKKSMYSLTQVRLEKEAFTTLPFT